MVTLIEVRGGQGELIGRCDAKCYKALEPDCECICGGMNHGSGLGASIDNCREHAKNWIEDIEEEKQENVEAEIDELVTQFDLFGEPGE